MVIFHITDRNYDKILFERIKSNKDSHLNVFLIGLDLIVYFWSWMPHIFYYSINQQNKYSNLVCSRCIVRNNTTCCLFISRDMYMPYTGAEKCVKPHIHSIIKGNTLYTDKLL